MEQINAIHTPQEFIVWKDDVIADFEPRAETDTEPNSFSVFFCVAVFFLVFK